MFGLTRKTDYALVALSRLAQQAACGGEPLSSRHIADQFGLPVSLLMNVLKDLQRAGIVESTRGSRGGYYLTRPAERITLHEVLVAIEGAMKLAPCCNEGEEVEPQEECTACAMTAICPIVEPVRRLHRRFTGFLEQVTIADLMDSKVDVPAAEVSGRA